MFKYLFLLISFFNVTSFAQPVYDPDTGYTTPPGFICWTGNAVCAPYSGTEQFPLETWTPGPDGGNYQNVTTPDGRPMVTAFWPGGGEPESYLIAPGLWVGPGMYAPAIDPLSIGYFTDWSTFQAAHNVTGGPNLAPITDIFQRHATGIIAVLLALSVIFIGFMVVIFSTKKISASISPVGPADVKSNKTLGVTDGKPVGYKRKYYRNNYKNRGGS
jgi:hypothetical protein